MLVDFANNNPWYLWVFIPSGMVLISGLCSSLGISKWWSFIAGVNPITAIILFLLALAPLVVLAFSAFMAFVVLVVHLLHKEIDK